MTQHYFSETPAGDAAHREITVGLGGGTHRVLTANGVFSPERLDPGTSVLLRALERSPDLTAELTGPVLDLGCGWGPIALDAALRHPGAHVWAVDVNERSRSLTAQNAERLGLANVTVVAPDDVPDDMLFSQIRSNPPIRVGKSQLHAILAHWLPRLRPAGSALLVVAKHLGANSLQTWLGTEFSEFRIERIARDRGYHVIEVQRPRDH